MSIYCKLIKFGTEICKDCYEELEELEDNLKELGKAFK